MATFSSSIPALFSALITLLAIPGTRTQKTQGFLWKFSESNRQELDTMIPCSTHSIVVESFDTSDSSYGVAPYYMISYELGGTPKISSLGIDPNNLQWTVNHAAGKVLILSVVDSQGTAGGTGPQVSVEAGDPNCTFQNADIPTDFTIVSNATNDIQTCEPWGIRISGGVKPYNLTLLPPSSPALTNITMGPTDDGYVYINRASPGSILVAAVSDSTGRYAHGTPSVNTNGSRNTTCPGSESASGSASDIPGFGEQGPQDANPPDPTQESRQGSQHAPIKTSTIIGIVVGGCVLVVIITSAFWCFRRYKQRRSQGIPPAGLVSPFMDNPTSMDAKMDSHTVEELSAHHGTRQVISESRAEEAGVTIQHQDSGLDCVHELPPPYADTRGME
ncbi:hypothetical protein VNI00_018374 [Paramarasmius palmivorus]|uniref:Mid2 domain-containing protein n=1 Tax=Paramarasmius palmivorus TaxID=297713 RepID=A0AAW0AXK8_9AGAR